MRNGYKNRIAALAAEIVHSPRFTPPRPPLYVWPGEVAPEAIRAARQQGRVIVYVYWKSSEEAEIVVDTVNDHIVWSTPQACPMGIEKFHANLATGELIGPSFAAWVRPEESLYENREEQQ